MGYPSLFLHLSILWTVFVATKFSLTNSLVEFETPENHSIIYTYHRYPEIREKCGSILSKASELEPDDDRGTRLRDDLSFLNGDWDQKSGGAPLMPFLNHYQQKGHTGSSSFLKLVSFWLSDVSSARGTKIMTSVSAVMKIGITQTNPLNYKPFDWSPGFEMKPGSSVMTILFEGVYFETNENGGERLMCLLGSSEIPAANKMVDLEENINGFYQKYENKPRVVKEDQIMLALRYPKTFTLTSGSIRGEMKSLHEKWDPKYFDDVTISSQLVRRSKYKFGAPELLAKACSPYPYPDKFADKEVMMFKGDYFCDRIWSYMLNKFFYFVPNWESGGYNDGDGQLGPFILGKGFEGNGSFTSFKLLVQNLECTLGTDQNKAQTANVSVSFRLLHLSDDRYLNEDRTGSSGTTLSAEGIWRSSGGQLCMVGCLGTEGEVSDRCNSRISLYIPSTFTINHRSMLFGVITSINEEKSQAPLLFDQLVHPRDVWRWLRLKWSYKYSKIEKLRTLWRRSKFSVLQKSHLMYPSPGNNATVSFSRLEDELSLHFNALPSSFYNKKSPKFHVELEILSIGPFIGEYMPEKDNTTVFANNGEAIEISGYMSITSRSFSNISLSFEGLYDPVLGKMHSVGCRDLKASPKLIKKGKNLEGGMDCMIYVLVEYPAINLRWLTNPRVKVSVSNKRNKEDPLYFRPISLSSDPISYKTKLGEVIFRKTFEGILRILLLIVTALCTLSQLWQTRNMVDPTAYISLAMLGIQALGYGIPLITVNETLFIWKVLESDSHQTSEVFKKFRRFHLLERVTRSLSLIALFLTLRLSQKVQGTRSGHLGHTKKPKTSNLRESKVLLITFTIHLLGFLVTQVLWNNTNEELPRCLQDTYASKLIKWLVMLDGYASVVQDLFLLPQVVGNSLWEIKGKPLRKFYYFGLTGTRVVLHVYEYLRDPVPDPYYSKSGNTYMGSDSFSKFSNIIMSVATTLLAVLLYVQQRSSYMRFARRMEAKQRSGKSIHH